MKTKYIWMTFVVSLISIISWRSEIRADDELNSSSESEIFQQEEDNTDADLSEPEQQGIEERGFGGGHGGGGHFGGGHGGGHFGGGHFGGGHFGGGFHGGFPGGYHGGWRGGYPIGWPGSRPGWGWGSPHFGHGRGRFFNPFPLRGHLPWIHWNHPYFTRPYYPFEWARVRAITCTAEDHDGNLYPVVEDQYFGPGYQSRLEQIEDDALDRCYHETHGDESCSLVNCEARY